MTFRGAPSEKNAGPDRRINTMISKSASFLLLRKEILFIVVLPLLWLITCSGFLLAPIKTSLLLHATDQQELQVEAKHETENIQNDDNEPFFDVLAGNVARCLIMSDLKRVSGIDGSSTGWTAWVEDSSAHRLQCCMDSLSMAIPKSPQSATDIKHLEERDEMQRWTRWMKASPTPIMMDLTNEMRQAVSRHLEDAALERIDSTRQEFLERISCRLIVMPSGTELIYPLRTPPGAMAFGKLLYGGIKRYRMIGSVRKRRAGERSLVYDKTVKSWLQYGGPERNYEAIDMGPCGFVELVLTPTGLSLPLLSDEGEECMAVSKVGFDPRTMFDFVSINETNDTEAHLAEELENDAFSVTGQIHIDALHSTFLSSVGGLQPQIQSIVRRVLDGRVVHPVQDLQVNDTNAHRIRTEEARALAELGLQPVRGLLLYGPPGCGKTALAREISRSLNARPPKIVAAPELLNKWVGGSEKLIRELFADAEAELSACNSDPTRSALHVVVIDEIDAVFRRRSAAEDSGEATRASAVNQLLSKIDGVKALGNVLVIGMTNRRELLDDALLRPGRLEVQVEIPLPDQEGRREILQIHFEALRRRNRLSQPLCHAIDGTRRANYALDSTSFWKRRGAGGSQWRIRDLANQRWTGGFSGADIAGLVRCAGSIALSRARADGGGIENLLITLEDVRLALDEVKQ